MDGREIASEDRWGDRRLRPSALAASPTAKPGLGKRRRCGDVARMRALRYARARRIRQSLWPLIAALILIGLIVHRQPLPVSRAGARPLGKGERGPPVPGADVGPGIDGLSDPADAGGMIEEGPQPKYRPPVGFLAKDTAQVVGFLIRNHGRLDNEAVRAKWDHVDRLSLPLAVYLREIEAVGAWDDVEKEIAAAPPGASATSRDEMPTSIRHRKILRLLPEWSRRGKELMSPEPAGDTTRTTPSPSPDIDGDDDPDKKLRKP